MSIAMARLFVADGVEVVACTPHILPGVYANTGPQIEVAVATLQRSLNDAGVPLKLVSGADNHVVPDFVAGLRSGHLLTLGRSRYVLVEPPHHVAPPRLENLLFDVLVAGYVPVLTHPERLTWLDGHYDMIQRLADGGVWMQVTAGSLAGKFGQRAKYWADRMLDEQRVHILATDAHDDRRRPPMLGTGREYAMKRVGELEAENLVRTRPLGILADLSPGELPAPQISGSRGEHVNVEPSLGRRGGSGERGFPGWMRRLFGS